MFLLSKYTVAVVAGALLLIGAAILMLSSPPRSVSAQSGNVTIARDGGTTIIQGGTGSPSFVPVRTTVAFHVEKSSNIVNGDFECLALAPFARAGHLQPTELLT